MLCEGVQLFSYKIKQNRESEIVNEPDSWFGNPRDLVAAVAQVVYVSVESARIIEGLPDAVVGEIE